jgi:hypothetical protein
MVLTRSKHKKSMEQNKETATSSDLSQNANSQTSNNPPLESMQLLQSTQNLPQVEDVTHNYKGMIDEELLEHMQNPETHQLIAAAMRLNTNQYMLELAKKGAKIPSTYDVSTIVELSQENLPITTHIPFPPLPNIDWSLPLPPSSFPPMTANKLQALQNHPLVDTHNLEANTVL